MAASIAARTAGKVAQYGIDSANIQGYDSGTILGNIPPGGVGQKLVDGTIQNAACLTADGTAGVVGNALVVTAGTGVAIPTAPAGTAQADGLSAFPARE